MVLFSPLPRLLFFTTQDAVIPVPQLTKPTSGVSVNGTSIEVCWAQQVSNGFRAELSKDPAFPARGTTLKTVDANTYCTTFDALTAATYYVRVRALTSSGTTESSTSSTVTLTDNTALLDLNSVNLKCFINNNELTILSSETFEASIQLNTLTGSSVLNKNVNIVSGTNKIQLNNTYIPKGAYILTIISNKKTFSNKIIN